MRTRKPAGVPDSDVEPDAGILHGRKSPSVGTEITYGSRSLPAARTRRSSSALTWRSKAVCRRAVGCAEERSPISFLYDRLPGQARPQQRARWPRRVRPTRPHHHLTSRMKTVNSPVAVTTQGCLPPTPTVKAYSIFLPDAGDGDTSENNEDDL